MKILETINAILKYCKSSMNSLTKLNVYLKDNNSQRYKEMNQAYVTYFKSQNANVCARITVGCGNLALGADVEIDGVAIVES